MATEMTTVAASEQLARFKPEVRCLLLPGSLEFSGRRYECNGTVTKTRGALLTCPDAIVPE